ncbi:hypothetical protein [Micromonospora sp. NPDC005206]|uniref:hypothetical protein n=1 Tax=Micromonospora sp. NPDC005206 TaxID=3157022 RepID=UPI0033B9093D
MLTMNTCRTVVPGRWGQSSHELGNNSGDGSCPDVWELGNGDVAVVEQDLTTVYRQRLPAGVSVDPGGEISSFLDQP